MINEATFRQALAARDAKLAALVQELQSIREQILNKPKSAQEALDDIKGRRIMYNLVGSQQFTTAQDGKRGNAISMTVSQDGPFIMTAYPIAIWRPDTPTNATLFGNWRPVSTWPLPTQQVTTDLISISYELSDSGSQRNFQNSAVPPLLSRPDEMMDLPVPTLFAPNAVISFTPTYEDISFSSSGTATTGGTLVVALPGYRIVSL